MKTEVSEDGILTLTFNTAPVNALTIDDLEEMQRALRSSLRKDIRGIVLTGDNGAFCAGLHREVFERNQSRDAVALLNGIVKDLINCDVPIAAGINGGCIGAGMVFALTCDYRVASSRTQFSLPELSLGMPISTQIYGLVRHWCGAALARDICMDGIILSSRTASTKGLVDRLAYPELCESQARTWVTRMLRLPAVAMRATHSNMRSDIRKL